LTSLTAHHTTITRRVTGPNIFYQTLSLLFNKAGA